MNPRIEADLVWFFGRASCAFERSTEGDRLERADMFAHDDSGALITARSRRDHMEWVLRSYRVAHGLPTILSDDESLDAIPSAAARPEPAGYSPSDYLVRRWAGVSRALSRCSSAQQKALAAYYGEAGARWDRQGGTLGKGRLVAVLPLTAAGSRLLAMRGARVGATDEGDAIERIVSEIQVARVRRVEIRDRLIVAAEGQARRLLAAALSKLSESYR